MPRAACRYRANMLPGFVEGSLLASRSQRLLVTCLLGEWTMPPPSPPHQTGLLHLSPPVAAWRGGGISHPPRPSSPSLHQQNRKASPSSLSSFCPPCIRFLRRAPSSTSYAVGGTLCPVPSEVRLSLFPALYRHGTIEDHSCSGGPGPNLAAVRGFFPARAGLVLRRTWRRRNKYRVTMEIRRTSKLFLVVFATVKECPAALMGDCTATVLLSCLCTFGKPATWRVPATKLERGVTCLQPSPLTPRSSSSLEQMPNGLTYNFAHRSLNRDASSPQPAPSPFSLLTHPLFPSHPLHPHGSP